MIFCVKFLQGIDSTYGGITCVLRLSDIDRFQTFWIPNNYSVFVAHEE